MVLKSCAAKTTRRRPNYLTVKNETQAAKPVAGFSDLSLAPRPTLPIFMQITCMVKQFMSVGRVANGENAGNG